MTVFVILQNVPYELDNCLVDIFARREDAQAACDEHNRGDRKKIKDFTVEEMEVVGS